MIKNTSKKQKLGFWRTVYALTFKPFFDIIISFFSLLTCLKEHREIKLIIKEFISSCKKMRNRKREPDELQDEQACYYHLTIDPKQARQMLQRMRIHTWCLSVLGIGISGLLVYQSEWGTAILFLIAISSLMAVNLWRQNQLRTLQQKSLIDWLTRR